MNGMISLAAACAVALSLGGCGTSTKVVTSNPESVSIVFDGDQSTVPAVGKLAAAECQKSGRLATLRDITAVDNGRVATYDCKRP